MILVSILRGFFFAYIAEPIYWTPGLVFTKGLRLSQILGLYPVLKLRLLSQLSFVLKPYSQRVNLLSPRLSNNHSGFLCHVTFLFYSNYTIGDIYPLFNAFYLRKSAVLKWKTLLPHINFPKTALVRGSV